MSLADYDDGRWVWWGTGKNYDGDRERKMYTLILGPLEVTLYGAWRTQKEELGEH